MKLISLLICLLGYLFLTRAMGATFQRLGQSKQVAPVRVKYLSKTANIALFAVFVFVICLVMGLGYSEVSLFLSSLPCKVLLSVLELVWLWLAICALPLTSPRFLGSTLVPWEFMRAWVDHIF